MDLDRLLSLELSRNSVQHTTRGSFETRTVHRSTVAHTLKQDLSGGGNALPCI